MRLSENEVCPRMMSCKHSDTCMGANSSRNTVFTCTLITEEGSIIENGFRNPLDQTGKMEILTESN